MRKAYRVLAYLVAAEVVVQAAAIAWAVAGLGHWVQGGGVFDASVMEDTGGPLPFPEVTGIIVHGINGSTIVPGLAVLLLVFSFFAKLRGATKWAVAVFVLVGVQAELGFAAGDLPALGALHGINALLLFSAALWTAVRASAARSSKASPEADEQPVSATV
jgi:heme A synthase